MMGGIRLVLLTWVLMGSALAKPLLQDQTTLDEAVVPFLEEHCFRCHGPEKQKGRLRLDTLAADFGDSSAAATWVEVLDNINLGEMPPEDEPIPDAGDLSAVTNWIAGELRNAKRSAQSTGGKVLIRRLSRTEYANTIRDLLNVEFLPNEGPMDLLPPDGTLDGFDKVSLALLLDPSLMDTYFRVAKIVVDKAVVIGEPPVPTWRRRMEYENISGGIEYIKKDRSVEVREDGLISMSQGMRTNEALYHPWNHQLIPVRGTYTVRLRMGADGGETDDPIYIRMKRQGDGEIFYTKVDAPIDQPKVYEFTRAFEPSGGSELGIELVTKTDFGRVDYYASDLTRTARELIGEGKATEAGRIRARAMAEGHFSARPHPDTLYTDHFPRVFFDWIEIEGPLYEQWPPASTVTVFPHGTTKDTQTLDHARAIFARLLPLAFRRPVEEREVEAVMRVVASEWDAEGDYIEAVKSGLMAMMCSPSFLYLFEPNQGPRTAARELNSYEVASRLSYFLWSSMPDERLFDLAEAGQLRSPVVLKAQVERMLKDPRAEAFVQGFGYQWLKAGEFDRFTPDQSLYRSFYAPENNGVNEDINREPLEFFREILENDLSCLDFLNANWTMLNERLASYYQIPGVEGEQFRRVHLPAENPRGGLVAMAAVHKWGSDGNRTKPVERGKYVLDVLFNDPPHPPPPNAGEVEPNVRGENLTVRQRLDQHRTIESCANCHRTIDPYGLALENFNAIGQWRTKQDGERAWWPDEAVIDASGMLPSGAEFRNLEEFKAELAKQSDRFLRGVSEKMFTYALGRTVEPADRATIDELVERMKAEGHTFRSLIKGIVTSEEFLSK